MIPLVIETLTSSAFAHFGDVIEAGPAHAGIPINTGTSQRFHDLARLDPGADGRLIVSIFRAQPRPLPFVISMLERHPKATQAFMPLSAHPFLIVVAPAGPPPETDAIRAFLASPCQGVNFASGVWHHPLLALEAESDFLVIDRDDPSGNCEEHRLAVERSLDLKSQKGF